MDYWLMTAMILVGVAAAFVGWRVYSRERREFYLVVSRFEAILLAMVITVPLTVVMVISVQLIFNNMSLHELFRLIWVTVVFGIAMTLLGVVVGSLWWCLLSKLALLKGEAR